MKEFFAWLFSQNNSDLKIGLYDGWHFLYLFIVFGGSILLGCLFRNRTKQAQQKLIRLFAYLTVGLYVADFFIMPLSDSYSGISAYKLPFNICTIMAVLVPFVQFNPRFQGIKGPVVTLSMTSSLMWMCYPGTALGGQPPFSYIIFQTFMYHGFLFCWGYLNVALSDVKMEIRKIWKEFVGILMILVWASFGNAVYDAGYNWFFIETSIFPFLSDGVMPPVVVVSVFLVCLALYGINYGVRAMAKKERVKIKNAA